MNFIFENHQIYVKNDEGVVIVNATFPFISDGVVNVNHTYVDPSLRGQGIASILMNQVYNHTKSKGFKVVATCPYAVVWFKKNQDKTDVLDHKKQEEFAPECLI